MEPPRLDVCSTKRSEVGQFHWLSNQLRHVLCVATAAFTPVATYDTPLHHLNTLTGSLRWSCCSTPLPSSINRAGRSAVLMRTGVLARSRDRRCDRASSRSRLHMLSVTQHMPRAVRLSPVSRYLGPSSYLRHALLLGFSSSCTHALTHRAASVSLNLFVHFFSL